MLIRGVRLHRLLRLLGCLCAAGALALAAVPAGTAYAVAGAEGVSGGGSAFSELTEGGQESTETSTTAASTTTSSSSSSSNSGTVLLIALIAAGILLAGIAFVILRDAHRVAPVPDGQLGGSGRSGRDTAVMMRRRRAKAKAARQQRKRNR